MKIKATILVAAPFDDESIESLTDFKITHISDKLREQAGRLVFFNGTDDPVVSLSEKNKYQAVLPVAEFILVLAPDHFMRVDFPELIDVIKERQL